MGEGGIEYRVVKYDNGRVAIHETCRGSRGLLVATQPVMLTAMSLDALKEAAAKAVLAAAGPDEVVDLAGASPGSYWWLVKDKAP